MSATLTWIERIARVGGRAVLPLPQSPAEAWGEQARYNLVGRLGTVAWRGVATRVGDQWRLPLGPVWLHDAGLPVGAEVTAEIGLEGPQLNNLPEDLLSALEASPEAKLRFGASTTFLRKNYLRWIEEAKRSDARAKRIAHAIGMLISGRERP